MMYLFSFQSELLNPACFWTVGENWRNWKNKRHAHTGTAYSIAAQPQH